MEEEQNHKVPLSPEEQAMRLTWEREQSRMRELVKLEAPAGFTLASLRFVAGLDLSFVPDRPEAVAALVVLDYQTLEVVYEDYSLVTLDLPYIPGFLAFREAPSLLALMVRAQHTEWSDGNGILHPRGLGVASQLGVILDIPTLGVAKTLFHLDGLDQHKIVAVSSSSHSKSFVRSAVTSSVRSSQYLRSKASAMAQVSKEFREKCLKKGDFLPLTGASGKVWGAALKTGDEAKNPVYISQGHLIDLPMSIQVSNEMSRFRVPEPTRQADLRSRDFIRKMVKICANPSCGKCFVEKVDSKIERCPECSVNK